MNHKPFTIPKLLVWEAWKRVKAAKGGPGVDNITLKRYEENLGRNLYKLWNRMSSGTYFPQPVKQVAIPKMSGVRLLGVPTVEDRIAQTTVKLKLEEGLEEIFLPESYGARPNRSAHEAIEACRQGCFDYDWAIDLDIKSYFDSIDHSLLMKAVKKHATTRWEILYIERWLNAPILTVSGELEAKAGKGIPQGATISPLLSNLFLHYALDTWMKRTFDDIQFERFLDDCVIHCKTRNQAEYMLRKIRYRLMRVGLTLNAQKTKLVMCLTPGRRKRWGNNHNVKFTFLGYEFKPRWAVKPSGKHFTTFTPSVSPKACSKLLETLTKKRTFLLTHLPLEEVAGIVNPIIRGWMNYFGAFRPSGMQYTLHQINRMIGKWMARKYRISKRKAQALIRRLSKERSALFHHWKLGFAT